MHKATMNNVRENLSINFCYAAINVPYMAKLSRGTLSQLERKVVSYSWKNFCGSMFVDLYCQLTRP